MNDSDPPPTLSQIIHRYVDAPNLATQLELFAALRHSKLGLRVVPPLPASIRPRQTHVIGPDEHLKVYTTRGPTGKPMLLAFADVAEWFEADRSIAYGEMDAQEVLEMAVSYGNEGVIINALPQKWIALTREDVLRLLKEWKDTEKQSNS